MRIFYLLIFTFWSSLLHSQEKITTLPQFEDSLIQLRKNILLAPGDSERVVANGKFEMVLEEALSMEGSFGYGFDSLPMIANMRSDDKRVRILNWNLPFDDGSQEYFGFVQIIPKKKKDEPLLFKLTDKSNEITKSPEHKALTSENWYGALYYEIITVKKRKKRKYVLLGWDGNDLLTSKKIIDILFLAGNKLRFGDAVFNMDKRSQRRVILEYSSDISISVRYHPNRKQIIFDHLAPSAPHLEGQYQYYGPDLSFDALELKKGKWKYLPDVDIRGERGENPVQRPNQKSSPPGEISE